MVRRIGIWSLGIFGALALAMLLGVWMLLPPDVSVAPRSDRMIATVTIWNPGEPLQPDQTIIVKDGRITEIRPSRPGDDSAICPDCIVMPGLIDAHVHTPPRLAIGNQRLFSLLYLKYGVTSVRDMGQTDDSITGLQAELVGGRIAGPRMYRCGPVLDGERPSWPSRLMMNLRPPSEAIISVNRSSTPLPHSPFGFETSRLIVEGKPKVSRDPNRV